MNSDHGMNRETAAERKKDFFSLILFGGITLFYLIFCFLDGPQLRSDSGGYIHMIAAREPVYPLFLCILRKIFGETAYLWVAVFLQNLLMAFAVWQLVRYLQKKFCLTVWSVAGMVMVNFGVELLCRFISKKGTAYPNAILTEGICLALWLIFLRYLTEAVLEGRYRALVIALLLAAVMTDTRKQMAVTYILICGSMVLLRIGRDSRAAYFKRILFTVLGCVLSLLLTVGGTRLYNYLLRGEFSQNTRDMNLVLTTTLYVADPEDESLIKEEEARALFRRTMSLLEESESNHRFAGESLTALEEHYEEHFDIITVETTKPLFEEDAIERGFAEGLEAEREADRISMVMVKALFMDNLPRYLRVYAASVFNGLINTIAARSRLMDVGACLVYIAYVVLMVICFYRRESRDAAAFAAVVLLGVLANVAVAAALIFCQSRYMIYNMAPFYMAGIVLLEAVIRLRKNR